ncbi:MAG: riboflavin synthase subunit alpha [Microbacterium sp. SCN 70-200]|uniref:riboflavin synthase n=1 Tax=unclassified Microbacterium TaxID=2609290 RepID=UPI00086C2A17|nr:MULTISPECIES: riboflavin synthase [unclassified Microbacterium]MBN9213789.1 riboflavin synthase [Microbacterium sp.]ODT42349.1 MAG: riboflavin synthase subunit alpha [Microbacterium sp. SCN 70-200]OJV85523.1 MAG: riboflavin synthase subunit alpha [Microbacterium sp. 70-16]
MFTGIIEERGTVTAIAPSGDGVRLTVHAPLAVSDAHQGDSISISGVCLTVVDQGDDWFTADVMRQTLDMSTLGELTEGSPVNVERAVSSHTRLGGHIVQGHVDGTGEVLEVRPGAQWQVIRFRMPRELAPLVVDKGSITVDGVSLTVSAVSPAGPSTSSGATSTTSGTSPSTGSGTTDWFEVSLIPETLEVTTLGARTVGDRVNLETDILARHVQRLLAFTTINEGGSR